MKIALSVPTGYNARELLVPLKEHLENDQAITEVVCISPAAPYATEVFSMYGPKFRFMANASDEASQRQQLETERPAIVVTPTSGLDTNDVPILAAAQSLRIPTFTFVSSWDNVYKMERLKNYGKPYVLADHIAVWNQMMHDHLYRIFPELKPDQVSIIGAPRFDFFTHTDRIPTKADLLNYLDLPNDGKPLMHIATTELYPMEYIVETIDTAVKAGQLPAMHLYASVHPGGDMQKHKQYAEKYNVRVRYSFGRRDNAPLKEFLYNPTMKEVYMLIALFKHTDVLVNHSSTVAIESFFCDVPVVNVKYGIAWDWWRWYRSMVYRDFKQHYLDITREGATDIVKSPQQLVQAIKEALDQPAAKRAQRAKTLQKMITYTDGSSSQRLLDLIKQHAAS